METKRTQRNKKPLLIGIACLVVAAIVLGVVLFLTQCSSVFYTPNSEKLAKQLASAGTLTITVDEDIILDAPLVVNGDKTIVGSGKIMLKTELEGSWPESSKPSWGMGCASLEAQDASIMPAALQVSAGATLNLGGSVTVDAEGNANGILLADGAALKLSESAMVKNGRYATLVIPQGANVTIDGGELSGGSVFNVLNHGTLSVAGGLISGAKDGANIYSDGTVAQSGGTVSLSGLHNVYVAGGTLTMTGGVNDGAAKDGIVVKENAKADITGGDISNCIHGICNDGETNVGEALLSECGIMNDKHGKLDIQGTTVDTSEVYCLANNGGTVKAVNFTAKKCDTVAVYNFSGDMVLKNITVSGGRDGNISNASGTMTIEGGILDYCRDKSVVVGNGKVVLKDVKINGTSNEKYGVYIFGGELYINGGSIENIDSTAVKADPGSYVELNNVTIKEVAQNGFQTDGGRVVINNVTLVNAKSHGIYNNGGEVTVNKMQITGVKKNAIQHYSGTTTVSGLEAQNMGNHGAFVFEGTLTVKNSSFKDMVANGVYILEGKNKLILEGVSISDAGQQGINNNSVVEIKNTTISNVGLNGVYNKAGGTMTVDGLKITNAGEHGISNSANMTAANISVAGTGKGKNGIQNVGTMVLSNAEVSGSQNHGIYNAGTLTATTITVNGTAENGVFNGKGKTTITTLTVSNTKGNGVNNSATITLSEVKINDAGKSGVYNSGGTAKIEKLTISGTAEHGINNAGKLTVTDVKISKTGEKCNSIQNTGNLTANVVVVTESKQHGIYNAGKLTVTSVTVSDTADNGVYNGKGEATITALTVSNTKGNGVNNSAAITLSEVKINDAGKCGVYNSDGTAKIEKLTISGTAVHGINNAAKLTVTDVKISKTGEKCNSIQNTGNLTANVVVVTESKQHGVYNEGALTATSVTVRDAGDNGVYNNKGEVTITELAVSNVKGSGVNNNSTISLSNATISNVGKNGVYNSDGTAKIDNLTVSGATEHGIHNISKIVLINAKISGVGTEFNGIQNYGKLEVTGLSVSGTSKHGVYNAGTLTAGKILISDAAHNGIHNDGTMTLNASMELKNSGNHGLYNGGEFSGKGVVIINAGDLLLSNIGDMTIDSLNLSGTAHKAIYNAGYAELSNTTIEGAKITNGGKDEFLVDNNGGVLDLTDATILHASGTALNIRGNGSVAVTNVIIDHAGNYGVFIEDGAKLSGDGFVINNITRNVEVVADAEGHAIKNLGKITMMEHLTVGAYHDEITGSGVAIDKSTSGVINIGVVLDKTTASFSGYDIEIHNVPNNPGIYNKGTVYITDLSMDNVKDGVACRMDSWATLSGNVHLTNIGRFALYTYGPEELQNQNGITIVDGTTVTIDGVGNHAIHNKGSFLAGEKTDITIRNLNGTDCNAIQNNMGKMTLGDVTIQDVFVAITSGAENVGTAINVSGHTTLYGELNISNLYSTGSAAGVLVRGASGKLVGPGSIIVTDGATVAGYNGICDGIYAQNQVLDITGDITINGTSRYGIYIYSGKGSVSARNVTISNTGSHGIWVNHGEGEMCVSETLTVNVTAGRGIYTRGTIEAKNIIISDAGDTSVETDRAGSITASENITVNGGNSYGIRLNGNESKLNAANITVNNAGNHAIWISSESDELTATGTITVNGGSVRGIYVYGKLNAGNIVCENTGAAGIRMDKAGSSITVTGDISINGNKDEQTIYMNGANQMLSAANITISNTGAQGSDGIRINSDTSKMTVSGAITISGTKGRGINTDGDVETGSISVSNAKDTSIEVAGKGSIVAEEITVNGGNTYGVRVNGASASLSATNITVNNAGNHAVWVSDTDAELTATGTITVNGGSGRGIYVYGKLNAGNIVCENTGAAGIRMDNDEATITVTGDITISGHKSEQAIYMNGSRTLSAANITINNPDKNGSDGIRINNTNNSKMAVSGTIAVNGAKDIGIHTDGTVEAGNISVSNTGSNGINNSGSITVTGAVNIATVAGHGISNSGTVTVTGVVDVATVAGHGINNSGTFTAGGKVTVKNVTGTAVNAIHNSGTMTLSDAEIDGVYVAVGQNTFVGNGITNAGTLTLNGTATITNVFTDVKGDSVGAGFAQTATGNTTGTGSLVITGTDATNSTYPNGINHGVYLDGSAINISGDITVSKVLGAGVQMVNAASLTANNITSSNSTGIGVYVNAAASLTAAGAITIDGTGSYGLNNAGTVNAGSIVVKNTVNTGINNTGTITVNNDASVENVTSGVGVYNTKTVTINGNLSVKTTGSYGVQVAADSAVLKANDITVSGSGNHAVWISKEKGSIIASGTITVNGSSGRGIYVYGKLSAGSIVCENTGKAGIRLDKEGSSITVTGDIAISGHQSEQAILLNNTEQTLSAANITISNPSKKGSNGIRIGYDESEMTVSGTITLDGAKENGISNAGTLEAGNIHVSNTNTNGVTNSGTVIVTGTVTVTNTGSSGISNSGTVTVTGAVDVATVAGHGINNSGTVTVTGTVDVATVAGHGISNTGTFAAGGKVTVKNVTGTAVNAIHNSGTMTLSDAEIDGVYVAVGQNTFVGNGINNAGTLTLNGTATITNVFTDVKGDSVGAGFAQTATGNTTGTGSLVITGSDATNSTYPNGINHGVYLDGSAINISGDITVSKVLGAGVNVANAAASLTANDVLVTESGSTGVNILGILNANSINTSATGGVGVYVAKGSTVTVTDGISTNGGTIGVHVLATLTAKNITVKNPSTTAIQIESGSTLTVTETLDITPEAGSRALRNYGTAKLNNVVITGPSGANAIDNENGASFNATGTITITNPVNARGIYNKGTFEAANIVVNNAIINKASAGNYNVIQNNSNKNMIVTNVTITGITSSVDVANCANGIYNQGTLRILGTVTISDVVNSNGVGSVTTDGNGIMNTGKIEPRRGNSGTYLGNVTVINADNYGVYSTGDIKLNKLTLTNAAQNISGKQTIKSTTINTIN